MKKRFGYFLLALLILVGLAFIIRSTSSKTTLRRYIAELREKGEKLSWSELVPVYSTNVEHIASRDIFATNKAAGALIVPEAMKFIGDGKARIGWKGDLHWAGMPTNTADIAGTTWKTLEEQNKREAKNRELFRLALKNPSPTLGPRNNSLYGLKLNILLERQVAQTYFASEMDNLHQGQTVAALKDIEHIIALVRLNKDEPGLAIQMMRNAIGNLGLAATWEFIQSPGLNDQMLSRLQQQWQEIDLFAVFEKGFLGDRSYGFEMLTKIQASRGAEIRKLLTSWTVAPSNNHPAQVNWRDIWEDHIVFPWYKMTSAHDDALFYLKSMQRTLEFARMLRSGVPYQRVKSLSDDQVREEVATLSRDRFHRYRFSEDAIPTYARAMEAVVRTETLRRLTVIAIALERYRLGHGEFPKELSLLTPGILVEVPLDPMSGKPICYRLNTDGRYVLYSVGEDGIDDGGIGGKGLWTGKDAVWPIGVVEGDDATSPAGGKGK